MASWEGAWQWGSDAFDKLPDDPLGTPFITGSDNPFDWAENGGPTVGPEMASLTGIQAAAADARALQNQFVAQMANQQATPGLSFAGSAPVVAAPSSVPGAAPPPAPVNPAAPTAQPINTSAMIGAQVPGAVPAGPGAAYAGGQTPIGGAAALQAAAGGAPMQAPPRTPAAGYTGSTLGNAGPAAGFPPAPSSAALSGAPPPPAAVGQDFGPFAQGIGASSNTGSAVPNGNYSASTGGIPGTGGPGGAATGGPPPTAPGMAAAAMQAALLDPAQQEQFRQQQMGLAGSLQDTIAGRGTSVAALQQQQAFAQQQAQQLGMAAAMGRGGNQALALRSAMGNMGQLGAQQAAASALQRAQEVATAQGLQGNVLTQGRGADIGIAGQNAANIQAGNLANAQLLQGANAANQQSQIGTRGQNITEQSNRANQALQGNKNQVDAASAQVAAEAANAKAKNDFNAAGLGAISTMSDRRVKTDVETASSADFREFLSAMKPAHWRYIGSKERGTGPMAQDVEKSRVGKTMVRDTPAGKAIDVGRATTGILGALADMHKRVSAVEGRKAA